MGRECANIDDDCVNYLVRLITLTLLQINDTGITDPALKNISALHNLKKLYLSLDIKEVYNQDLIDEIKIPECDIIVNETMYEQD